MEGNFNKSPTKYIYCLFLILGGSYIAVRFSLWGIDELNSNQISSAVLSFIFALGGLIFGSLSILIFTFNRKAFFNINGEEIDARFGWGNTLHININKISKCALVGKHLKLTIDDEAILVYHLNNAKELCEYISSRSIYKYPPLDIDKAKISYQKNKRKFVTYLIFTIIVVIMLFINIAWCVLLTGGKGMSEFSNFDDLVFSIFTFTETITFLTALFLARKCGKHLEKYNNSKSDITSALATEHVHDTLEKYINLIDKKYFDRNTYRIIIFAPTENTFAYMLEKFDMKTICWTPCYDGARGFDTLSELYEDLENMFEDVILE